MEEEIKGYSIMTDRKNYCSIVHADRLEEASNRFFEACISKDAVSVKLLKIVKIDYTYRIHLQAFWCPGEQPPTVLTNTEMLTLKPWNQNESHTPTR